MQLCKSQRKVAEKDKWHLLKETVQLGWLSHESPQKTFLLCGEMKEATMRYAKIWERNLYGQPISRILVVKTIRGSSDGPWMGKCAELGMLFLFTENKDGSYRYTWMTLKMAGKTAEYGSNVAQIDEQFGS